MDEYQSLRLSHCYRYVTIDTFAVWEYIHICGDMWEKGEQKKQVALETEGTKSTLGTGGTQELWEQGE